MKGAEKNPNKLERVKSTTQERAIKKRRKGNNMVREKPRNGKAHVLRGIDRKKSQKSKSLFCPHAV